MDIDIDLPTKISGKDIFPNAIVASLVDKNNELTKHPCGHYFQNIPVDQITGYSAIPYQTAEEMGYLKIDFLHLNVLDEFSSKKELRKLIHKQPNWNLLLDKDIVSQLFQLANHFDLIKKVKPRSVDDLADCTALIRPGKKELLNEYLTNKQYVRTHKLYKKTEDSNYSYKRSHAISYALTIVAQLNKIEQSL